MTEELDIYNLQYQKTGKPIDRKKAHEQGFWHESIHIWFINSNNQLLLQKRSEKKRLYPNMWIAPVSGHISAGEDKLETALREAKEETGLILEPDELEFISTLRLQHRINEELNDKEFINIYITHKDFPAPNIKNDEVAGFEWISLVKLSDMLEQRDPQLSPCWEEYHLLLNFIKFNIIDKDIHGIE